MAVLSGPAGEPGRFIYFPLEDSSQTTYTEHRCTELCQPRMHTVRTDERGYTIEALDSDIADALTDFAQMERSWSIESQLPNRG